MTDKSKFLTRIPARLTAFIAACLVALQPAAPGLANPGMGSMGASPDSPKKSSGCGGCGGGSERQGPSADELRQRAKDAAAEGASDGAGGITSGSGGRRSEDLTGTINTLGRAERPGEEVLGPVALPGKGAALDDLNTLIDAGVDPEQAARLKDIARRSTDLARSDADLARIRTALEDEIRRQQEGKLIPQLAAGASEIWQQTKDFAWRDGQKGKHDQGVLPDVGNIVYGTGKAAIDAEVAIGETIIDGTLAVAGDREAQNRTNTRYEDAAKATLDTADKIAAEAGKIPGKFSDAARDTKNLINDPHLRGLAIDEANRQATDLADDAYDAFAENDPKKRDAAQDRLIKRAPGGENYLAATQDPDKPATERALQGGLAGLELGGAVVTAVEGVNLGKAIAKGITGSGASVAAEVAAGAGASGEAAATRAGSAGEAALARGASAGESAVAGAEGAGAGSAGRTASAADEAALAGRGGAQVAEAEAGAAQGAKPGRLAQLEPDDPRLQLTAAQNAEISGQAKTMLERAQAAEPAITKDVESLTKSAGGKMEGLEFKLKGDDSLERKIATDVKKGISPQAAAQDIKDVNRYTSGFEPDQLVDGYDKVMAGLKDQGYEITKVKNTWLDPTKSYKGVNVQATTPTGQPFELQFHTPQSYWAKSEGTHKIYEEMRLLEAAGKKGNPRWLELDAEQMKIANSLERPKGIESVKEVGK